MRDRGEEIEDALIVEDLGIWPKTIQQESQWTKMEESFGCEKKRRGRRN